MLYGCTSTSICPCTYITLCNFLHCQHSLTTHGAVHHESMEGPGERHSPLTRCPHPGALPCFRIDQPSFLCRAVIYAVAICITRNKHSLCYWFCLCLLCGCCSLFSLSTSLGRSRLCVDVVGICLLGWAQHRPSLHASLCRVSSSGNEALFSLGNSSLHIHHLCLLREPGSM